MTAHGALFLWTGLTFLREAADAEFYLSPVLLNIAFAVWNSEARFEYEALFFAGWADCSPETARYTTRKTRFCCPLKSLPSFKKARKRPSVCATAL